MYLTVPNPIRFRNFKIKAVERTVDAYPGLTPEQRYLKSMQENNGVKVSKKVLKSIFKNHKI